MESKISANIRAGEAMMEDAIFGAAYRQEGGMRINVFLDGVKKGYRVHHGLMLCVYMEGCMVHV